MTSMKPVPFRIASIDIFRGMTMLLMIFVNDLWSLRDIPAWLEHTPADYDGMGLADVVFPAFLFIVGLSIPYAIKNRIRRGDNRLKIVRHIFARSFALIIMGFSHVNFEHINSGSLLFARPIYEILMTISFFLIWNMYPENGKVGKIPSKWFQRTGIILLILLAIIYRGGTAENPGWMRPYWWGILGLIGWSYLVSAFICLFAKNRFWLIGFSLVFFCFLNFLEFIPLFGHFSGFRLIISASNYSLVLSGVLTSAVLEKLAGLPKKEWIYAGILILLSASLIGYEFWIRPWGGISKIRATPSWTAICAGISLAVYALLYTLADKYRLTRWAQIIAPAGRSTLTCYLIPYLVYPLMALAHWHWPEIISSGYPGLIKSLAFALVIVGMTGLLEKIHIRLKI